MPNAAGLILVVDDDEAMRDAATECLTDDGYDVRAVPNGQEALEVLVSLRPDLIIVDWRMPVLSGEELLAALQADASLATIPAIVLTASHPWEIKVENATILQKPVRMKALLEAVRARLRPPG
jgi:CheY-like chemotaxis protein